jgi:hypothetical protein
MRRIFCRHNPRLAFRASWLVIFLFQSIMIFPALTGTDTGNDQKVFKNQFVKITIKSFKKTRDAIYMTVVYENTSGKELNFGIDKKDTFLTDENGERWDYKDNTAIKEFASYSKLLPNSKIVSKFTFTAKGKTGGKVFNLYGDHQGFNSFVVIINDILIN